MVEESDELGGGFISHFELYVQGMAEAGADTTAIDTVHRPAAGRPPVADGAGRGRACRRRRPSFVRDHLGHHRDRAGALPGGGVRVRPRGPDPGHVHPGRRGQRAAATSCDTFVDYLERHIEVDGEQHTPMAMQMLADLCGDDDAKWQECADTVNLALAARASSGTASSPTVKEAATADRRRPGPALPHGPADPPVRGAGDRAGPRRARSSAASTRTSGRRRSPPASAPRCAPTTSSPAPTAGTGTCWPRAPTRPGCWPSWPAGRPG